VIQFKCNGCARNTEFIELDSFDLPENIWVYQCKDCGCVGVKNKAEQVNLPKDTKVSRCNSCGAWQFDGVPCHTCMVIAEYDNQI
jgi:hypothetical protein